MTYNEKLQQEFLFLVDSNISEDTVTSDFYQWIEERKYLSYRYVESLERVGISKNEKLIELGKGGLDSISYALVDLGYQPTVITPFAKTFTGETPIDVYDGRIKLVRSKNNIIPFSSKSSLNRDDFSKANIVHVPSSKQSSNHLYGILSGMVMMQFPLSDEEVDLCWDLHDSGNDFCVGLYGYEKSDYKKVLMGQFNALYNEIMEEGTRKMNSSMTIEDDYYIGAIKVYGKKLEKSF